MTVEADWVVNARAHAWSFAASSGTALEFHRSLPAYAATPLVELSAVAAELNVGRVFAKDESSRLGLPAFKALGASWAVDRALSAAPARARVVTATDGNHGRAVARFSLLAGRSARIFIPRGGVHPHAVQAILDEGAQVVEVDGTYDDAVAAAARSAARHRDVLVQDTAWDGYEQVPAWIVEGYDTLFAEVDEQLIALGADRPDLLMVPTGVGSLLQAAVTHYRSGGRGFRTAVIAVEPTSAACITASIRAGEPVTVETGATIMSGLNCGTPSTIAWPVIRAGLDASVAIPDHAAVDAARTLAVNGVHAGPCGAASLAGARAVLGDPERRSAFGIDEHSVVVLTITEGADANPVRAH
ncbi:diaminopropionate ammonia-lyase [Microbacterium sp. cf046]|uniref:pyridoxal-phosphate dependent enzyme n=1 Tax=Microbacterium sp. cf046 TaxID=1761803 RepID=UPI0008F28DF2|nr:pyridoxal-phosphate dependent enzyme [Microbacterium sp. cf046]SFS15621.1 diaminopropionate ammonia-lyase [Microbacterium sp. cf046]